MISGEIGDQNGEQQSLNYLGNAHYALKNYEKAIELHEQSLVISTKFGNIIGEGESIASLGNIYYSQHKYAKALEFQEKGLVLLRKRKQRKSEGELLGNLGNTLFAMGQYDKAIEYHEQSLAIAREMEYREGERNALSNLGDALARQEPELAIAFYKQSVNIAESIRNNNHKLDRTLQSSYTETVAGTYRNLADLLLSQGRVLEAQQALELLKIQELRDFTKDTRYGENTDRNLLNPLENPVIAAANDKIKLGDRLTQCEQTKCSERSQLIAQVTQANETFDQQVIRLKKALKAGESQDPAQLQNEEFTRNAQNIILECCDVTREKTDPF